MFLHSLYSFSGQIENISIFSTHPCCTGGTRTSPKFECQPQVRSFLAGDKLHCGCKQADDDDRLKGAVKNTFTSAPSPLSSIMGSQRNGFNKERFILSVDVGTTTIRCHVYDKNATIRGSCSTQVVLDVCCFWLSNNPTYDMVYLLLKPPNQGGSLVSRGGLCRVGAWRTLERICQCGQRSCSRYRCTTVHIHITSVGCCCYGKRHKVIIIIII